MSGTGVLVTCARPAFDRFGVVTATYCIRNERCRGAKRPFSDRAHGPLSNRADSAAKSGGFRITAVQASLIPGLRSPDVFHVRPCCPINTRRFHGARPAGRQIAVCSAAAYKAPSSAPSATELDLLLEYTNVVPDTALMASAQDTLSNKAGTSSCGVLRGILNNPADLQQFKTAVERALVYDKCAGLAAAERAACQLDKALVNVAALFASQVDGRVSTEVDPRTAFDTDSIVERGRRLVGLFKEVGVPSDKYLLRIPATWQGIQAAKVLEGEGVATHLILIYSFVQAAAAAQAGVSVISPNIGRIGDFYQRNPGAIRNPRGPREDAGVVSKDNPGVGLVQRIFNYVHKHGSSRTVVMASGVRTSAEAFELAGIDYMTVSPRVLKELGATATMSGYNDGLSGGASGNDASQRKLSRETAQSADFSEGETAKVDEAHFREGLDRIGVEMLEQGVQGLVDTVERLLPELSSTVVDAE